MKNIYEIAVRRSKIIKAILISSIFVFGLILPVIFIIVLVMNFDQNSYFVALLGCSLILGSIAMALFCEPLFRRGYAAINIQEGQLVYHNFKFYLNNEYIGRDSFFTKRYMQVTLPNGVELVIAGSRPRSSCMWRLVFNDGRPSVEINILD